MAHRSAGQPALTRQLALLDAFDHDHPFLTLSEMARRAGLDVSSAHRAALTLTAHGLLERHDGRQYRLGLRLFELATRVPGALGLREAAMPTLEHLHRHIGHHVQLGVLAGLEVLFIERLSARDSVVNITEIGGRLPLHLSSSGLVLLAYADSAVVNAVLGSPLRPVTAASIADRGRLERELEAIRRNGGIVADGFIHPDARGIAVPLYGVSGTVVAALAAIVPADETDPIVIMTMLREGAAAISADLRKLAASPGNNDLPLRALRWHTREQRTVPTDH